MAFKTFLFALAIPTLCIAAAIPQDVEFPEIPEDSIVGGGPARQGDIPFIVSMSRNGNHICGGSLLNANTVLTAAHCAVGQTASALGIRAGSLNRASGGTLVGVSSIRVHPSYSSASSDNDVAILRLATPIPSSSTIGYATLPAQGSDPAANTLLTVAGWGSLSSGSTSSPTALQKVDVPVVSRATCKAQYDPLPVTNNMFCAGLAAGGKDSCQGDSGGPIIDASSKVLVGVVSWGLGCAEPAQPGVYARIGSLLSFITSNS